MRLTKKFMVLDAADAAVEVGFWAALEEALGLGATLLQPAAEPEEPGGFHVLADPAGHPFCLCWE